MGVGKFVFLKKMGKLKLGNNNKGKTYLRYLNEGEKFVFSPSLFLHR
jgi:hypothetical protein